MQIIFVNLRKLKIKNLGKVLHGRSLAKSRSPSNLKAYE
jgi:hypothetical protein